MLTIFNLFTEYGKEQVKKNAFDGFNSIIISEIKSEKETENKLT